MKNELELQDNESLHDWINRLSDALGLNDKMTEVMLEVSKQSYIKGSNSVFDLFKNDEVRFNADMAYCAWMGDTMENVRYWMDELGKSLGYKTKKS